MIVILRVIKSWSCLSIFKNLTPISKSRSVCMDIFDWGAFSYFDIRIQSDLLYKFWNEWQETHLVRSIKWKNQREVSFFILLRNSDLCIQPFDVYFDSYTICQSIKIHKRYYKTVILSGFHIQFYFFILKFRSL